MNKILCDWKSQLVDLKDELYIIGSAGDSLRYNLLSTEAMVLSRCIIDLQERLLEYKYEVEML